MPYRIVNATNLDLVRVEVLGDGRAVTIPADLIIAVDRVLRHVLLSDGQLSIDPVEDDDTGQTGWQATTEHDAIADAETLLAGEISATPWEAVLSLAEVLTRMR